VFHCCYVWSFVEKISKRAFLCRIETGTVKRYRFKSTDINLDSPAVIRAETLHGTLGVIYGPIAGNVDVHFLDNWRFYRDSWVDFQRKSSCTCVVWSS